MRTLRKRKKLWRKKNKNKRKKKNKIRKCKREIAVKNKELKGIKKAEKNKNDEKEIWVRLKN